MVEDNVFAIVEELYRIIEAKIRNVDAAFPLIAVYNAPKGVLVEVAVLEMSVVVCNYSNSNENLYLIKHNH